MAVSSVITSATTTYTGAVIRPTGTTIFSTPSILDDVSDGGSFAVGYVTRYDASGTPQDLIDVGTRPLGSERFSYISGDGSSVATTYEPVLDAPTRAIYWNLATGGQILDPYRANANYTNVRGLSRDGSTIVGNGSMFFGAVQEAWKWTATSGYTILAPAPGSNLATAFASASNNDGSIIAGLDTGPNGRTRAIIWTNEVPLALVPSQGYRDSVAHDLSDDGTLIVGRLSGSQTGLPDTDAMWTESTGWIPALDFMRMNGVDVPSYYTGNGNVEVSADGRTFTTILLDTRTGERPVAVFVIPSPSGLALLGVLVGSSRRARARR